MLFTWGKVRIGHLAPACRQLLQPLCAASARVSLRFHATYVSEGSGPAVPSPAGGPPAAGSSFAGRSDLFSSIAAYRIKRGSFCAVVVMVVARVCEVCARVGVYPRDLHIIPIMPIPRLRYGRRFEFHRKPP